MGGKETGVRRILFDIEATELRADEGYMLCFGWQVVGEDKVHLESIRDGRRGSYVGNDKALVGRVREILTDGDMWATWYGKRYDVKFIQSRLSYYHMKPLPRTPHWDGWEVSRSRLALSSNRLENVSDFLNIHERKTKLTRSIWRRAAFGSTKDLRYIEKHCIQDIKVLEEVYEQLAPLYDPVASIAVKLDRPDQCPICSSGRVWRRGSIVTRARVFGRYQCQGCGAWFRDGGVAPKNKVVR